MTIKELILENDNFAKSEEAFEIYKESAELNVLNAWIECQEHKAFTNCDMFTEADDDALTSAKEKAEAKEEALYKKILDGIKKTASKIWNAILKIIDKIIGVFRKKKDGDLSKVSEETKKIFMETDTFKEMVKKSIDKIVSIYKDIPYVGDISFTKVWEEDLSTWMKVSVDNTFALTGLKKMAAAQIGHAILCTGVFKLFIPSLSILANMDMNYSLNFENIKVQSPAKYFAKLPAFSSIDSNGLEEATNTIKDALRKFEKLHADAIKQREVMKATNYSFIYEILGRDLKVMVAANKIQNEIYRFIDEYVEKSKDYTKNHSS